MGIYFHYANLTKRERFAIDALGGGLKFGAAGRTLASRALHLLLMKSDPLSTIRMPMGTGRWSGDAITIVGDDLLPDWLEFQAQFKDIAAHALLAVFSADGFEEIANVAEHDARLFIQVGYLISTHQAPQLEHPMQQRFGPTYLKRCKELCRTTSWFTPADLLPT